MNGRSCRDSSGRCTTLSALFSIHLSNSDLTLAFAAWSVRSSPSTSATAEPAQPFAVGLCRHSPAAIAFWTRNRSSAVTSPKAEGHSQVVTTPTLSPSPLGPLPSCTLSILNQSDRSAGGARLLLSLKALKYSRGLSTPPSCASLSDIR